MIDSHLPIMEKKIINRHSSVVAAGFVTKDSICVEFVCFSLIGETPTWD